MTTEPGPRPPRARILLAFAAIYLVWGSTYLAIRFVVDTLPPFIAAGARFLVAGAIMYAWARSRGAPRPTRVHWRAAILVGALLLAAGNGGVSWAEQRIASGLAALLVATAPVWMVLLAWAFGGTRPVRGVWIGLVVGFVGLLILVGPAELLGGRGVDPFGAAAVIAGSMAWALGSIVSGRVSLPESPILASAMEMLGGGAVLLVGGTLAGEWGRLELAGVSWESWTALLYLVLIGSLVGFSSYVWLLRHVEVARVATYAYVNPVVAVLLGWLLAGEELTPRTLVAAAVIVAGVVFITTARGGRIPPPARAIPDPRLASGE